MYVDINLLSEMCIYEYSTLSMRCSIWSFTSELAPVWSSTWGSGLGYASSKKGDVFGFREGQILT